MSLDVTDKAIELFTKSLEKVESASIREWAQTDHNKPLFLQMCQVAVDKGKNPALEDDVLNFSTYMTALAMGL